MLNKYQDFHKLSKSEECSVYTAVSRDTGHGVLLKRVTNKLSWDQVLKNRNMQFSQKNKMFPKMVEIFKNKGDFYIVYQRPTGHSLKEAQDIGPLTLEHFYTLFHDLCQHLKTLKQMIPGLYVLPQWIFMHRHSIKLVHFQPFFLGRQALSSDHVYLYKIQNNLLPTEKDDDDSSSIVPSDKKRNLIFNLGLTSYYLLTGIKHKSPQSEQQYLQMVNEIADNAEKRIVKHTNDRKLAFLVGKMLTKNMFEVPEIQSIANFMQKKANEMTPKKKLYSTNIEIDIQHIKLENSRNKQQIEVNKKLRTCCAEKESSLDKINQQIRHNREIRQNREKDHKQLIDKRPQINYWGNSNPRVARPSPRIARSGKKTIFPKIKIAQRLKTSENLMNTTNSKPLMFNTRSMLF